MMAESIKEQLELLMELQSVDSKIYELKQLTQQKPLELESLKVELEKKKVRLSEAENKYKSEQVNVKEMELELQQRDASINKLQGQLYQLKTNKEYTTMQREIEGLKADKAVLEESILEFMDKVEVAKAEVAKEKQALDNEEKKMQEEEKRIEGEIAEIKIKLEMAQQDRLKYLPRVDKKLLELYERILKSKNGLAITCVKDGACQACFMHMRPQVINEIQLKEKPVVCESCSRILYIE